MIKINCDNIKEDEVVNFGYIIYVSDFRKALTENQV